MANLRDFTMKTIDGDDKSLADYEGKVVLVVNVASKCGLTPQYEGLQRLYENYRRQGLEILAFPCNQFAGQEPGTQAEIKDFCELGFGITFPLFGKIEVNGEGQADLYAWLTAADTAPEGAGDVKWNFGKFLIGKDGEVIARFAPPTEPQAKELVAAIEAAL